MALTTLADIKTFLGITDNSQDALLTMFKDSIEQSIIHYCESDFTSKAVTNELSDGVHSDVIVPRNYPLISIQKVSIGVDSQGLNGSELDTSQYYFDDSAIYLTTSYTTFARASVRVDYTWGYAAIPADVKMSVYQSVKAELQRYERKTEDMSSRSKGDESEGYGSGGSGIWDSLTGLPKTIVAKLQYYKSYEFPHAGMAQRNL